MKAEPTIRDICGTEPGYRKHRRTNEHSCQECRDAHNIWRREYAENNPDKNKQYRANYASSHPERIKSQQQRHCLDPEEKQRRKDERKAQTLEKLRIAKEAKKEARKQKLEAQMAETAARNAEAKRLHQLEVAERARIRDEETAQRRAKKAEEKSLKERFSKLDALMAKYERQVDAAKVKEQKALEKQTKQEELNNRHGVELSDYYRCQKNNGVACDPCKALVAKYAREYRKANPEIVKKWESQKGNNSKSIRERLKPGAIQVYYSRVAILKRDNYTCYLCNELVDLEAAPFMNQEGWELYPHLDHVIPLSKGGDDTPDNVRTTHAKCNMEKLDRILDTPVIML